MKRYCKVSDFVSEEAYEEYVNKTFYDNNGVRIDFAFPDKRITEYSVIKGGKFNGLRAQVIGRPLPVTKHRICQIPVHEREGMAYIIITDCWFNALNYRGLKYADEETAEQANQEVMIPAT